LGLPRSGTTAPKAMASISASSIEQRLISTRVSDMLEQLEALSL
jgi:hypothetical protein